MKFAFESRYAGYTIEASNYAEAVKEAIETEVWGNKKVSSGIIRRLGENEYTPEQQSNIDNFGGHGCPGCGFEVGKTNIDGYAYYGVTNYVEEDDGDSCPFCGRFFHEMYLDEVAGVIG